MTHIILNTPLPLESLDKLRVIPHMRITPIELGLAEHHDAVEFPADVIRDADVLVCSSPPTNFADMPALKFIQLVSVGYSQLYKLDVVSRGIRVANARGVYDTAIGEWNLAMM